LLERRRRKVRKKPFVEHGAVRDGFQVLHPHLLRRHRRMIPARGHRALPGGLFKHLI
jgi:hypothetical protein